MSIFCLKNWLEFFMKNKTQYFRSSILSIDNRRISINEADLKLSCVGLETANVCIKYSKEEFFNILDEYIITTDCLCPKCCDCCGNL